MFNPSRVVANYKSKAGVTTDIPALKVLVEEIYNELTTHGEVNGLPGTVNGTCPTTGGPLAAGALTGGKIL